jgi:hypothetical protein
MAERLEALARAAAPTEHPPDTFSHPRHLAESSHTGTDVDHAGANLNATPAQSAVGWVTSDVPPSTPFVTDAVGTGHVPAERLVTVGSTDQTARLEVSPLRTDRAIAPPERGADHPGTGHSVPSGVALLRDSLGLPPSETLVIDDADRVPPAPTRAPGDGPGFDASSTPLTVLAAPGDDQPTEDEPPRGGSSAATIADLLRHGGSGLFFHR